MGNDFAHELKKSRIIKSIFVNLTDKPQLCKIRYGTQKIYCKIYKQGY